MAAVLLFLLSRTGFSRTGISWLLVAAVAMALPAFFDVVGKRGIDPVPVEAIMIALSMGTTLLYVYVSAANELARTTMTSTVVLIHMCAWAVFFARLLYAKKTKGTR